MLLLSYVFRISITFEYFRLYQEIIITFALPSFFGYLILQILVKSDINLTTVREVFIF